MAGDFLKSHGIDIDAEMHRIQCGEDKAKGTKSSQDTPSKATMLCNVSLPNTLAGSRWNVRLQHGSVESILETSSTDANQDQSDIIHGHGALLVPSLCHPHIHLDKAFLLSHPEHSHLQVKRGDFAEAMELTGLAKANFSHRDLIERGQRVIDESIVAGVTHMRAFVELDAGVGTKCVDAGLELKRAAAGRCHIQLCAFAQLPLFTASQADPEGEVIRGLMEQAAANEDVEALGSTPYVEGDREKMEKNVAWLTDLAIEHNKHLDFHLDYNLDSNTEPLVWHVLATLRKSHWTSTNTNRTIVLGHCTRLTLFSDADWHRLRDEIAGLPISFVGLPTSDLFMMRTENRVRGTLDVPQLIKEYQLNACLSINNIGNAFTPHGSCDPLTLACNGVGIYQAGTERDAQIMYECVSTRAREAIGLGWPRKGKERGEESGESDAGVGLQVQEGDRDLLLFGAEEDGWRTRRSVSEAVYLYDHGRGRRVLKDGGLVS